MNNFDETLGRLASLPDATSAGPSTVRAVGTLGVGPVSLWIVQTIRHRETGGDFVFLEYVAEGQAVRLVLPPSVAEVVARQRDTLTTKNRSKAARGREPTAKQLAARAKFAQRARSRKK